MKAKEFNEVVAGMTFPVYLVSRWWYPTKWLELHEGAPRIDEQWGEWVEEVYETPQDLYKDRNKVLILAEGSTIAPSEEGTLQSLILKTIASYNA